MNKRSYKVELVIIITLLIILVFETQIETFLYDFFQVKKNPVQWISLTSLLLSHIKLVTLSISLSLIVTIVIALILHLLKIKALEELFFNVANIGTTFPSIAIMALLVPIVGYGFKPVFFALSLYSFLPMFIGIMSGLNSIDRSIILSAESAGMNKFQLLFKIELPLAKRMIISGFKTALIINISTATIGSVVGANSLGLPIVIGIRSSDIIMIFKGSFPVALLAFLVESILSRFEGVAPWQKQ